MTDQELTTQDAAAQATLFAAARQVLDRYLDYINRGYSQDAARFQAAGDSVSGLQAIVNAAIHQSALSDEKAHDAVADQRTPSTIPDSERKPGPKLPDPGEHAVADKATAVRELREGISPNEILEDLFDREIERTRFATYEETLAYTLRIVKEACVEYGIDVNENDWVLPMPFEPLYQAAQEHRSENQFCRELLAIQQKGITADPFCLPGREHAALLMDAIYGQPQGRNYLAQISEPVGARNPEVDVKIKDLGNLNITHVDQGSPIYEFTPSKDHLGEITSYIKRAGELADHAHKRSPAIDTQEMSNAEMDHQRKMLAQALGEVLAWSGVIHKDVAITGPELLTAAHDLVNSPSPLAEQKQLKKLEAVELVGRSSQALTKQSAKSRDHDLEAAGELVGRSSKALTKQPAKSRDHDLER